MTSVVERLQQQRPAFSVEFFPPRDDADEVRLWRSIRKLETLDPAFVSVTYGAGGSSRERTVRTTRRIAEETTLTPVAHLTAVSHTVDELRHVVGQYAASGVRNVLVIRGDPPEDPMGPWVPHPDGVTYASELVDLVASLGRFCIGVAAFPSGHPRSSDLAADTDHLVAKLRAGAHFTVAQLFFEPEQFLRLRDRLADRGCGDIPLLPGVMPLTTMRTFRKATELSGVEPPPELTERLERFADDPASFRAEGMDAVYETCSRLLTEGVDGLHFYTLNRSTATLELADRLGLTDPAGRVVDPPDETLTAGDGDRRENPAA